MIRRFECVDLTAFNFWEISLTEQTVTTRYGRIGTKGRSLIKAHATETAARLAVEKQVAEKLKKGYQEVSASPDGVSNPAARATESARAQHAASIRSLLRQKDHASVQQGLTLLRSLADFELWAPFAAGVDIGRRLSTNYLEYQQIEDMFVHEVAFWALRETGRLAQKTHLCLTDCGLVDLRPLHGLTALEALDLHGCSDLTSLDGIEHLPSLHAIDLSDCRGIDLAALHQVPALTSLRLRNWTSLTSLAALAGLTHLESLDLSGCTGLTSLDELATLPALREVRLDGCDRLTTLAGLPSSVRIAQTPAFGKDAFVVRYGHRPLWMSDTDAEPPAGVDSWDWFDRSSLQLRLNGLTSLSEGEAQALISPCGVLSLDGLDTIAESVMAALARQGGTLSLNGLTTLSQESATLLAGQHAGALSLHSLAFPIDADEIFAKHGGRVSLGAAFQNIDVGRFDATHDVEIFGPRIDATSLVVPVEGTMTFTLHYNVRPRGQYVIVGIINDDKMVEVLDGDADEVVWDCDDILKWYGPTIPATHLELPDGQEVAISLRHWPRELQLKNLAEQRAEIGAFVHITHCLEVGHFGSHSLTLQGGVFDLGRVRCEWDHGFVTGYSYQHEDGQCQEFVPRDDETRSKYCSSTIYMNTGAGLVELDVTAFEPEIRSDVERVRQILLDAPDNEDEEDGESA